MPCIKKGQATCRDVFIMLYMPGRLHKSVKGVFHGHLYRFMGPGGDL